MTDEASDTRHHPRVKNLNLVQIDRHSQEGPTDLATGRTLDISGGGIRLELYHPLPLRSMVEVTLALDEDLVDVRGKVVYLEEIDDERCAMGIQFLEMSVEDRQRLAQYLDKSTPDTV